jgi:hypothetical protein
MAVALQHETSPAALLHLWLRRQISADAAAWLDEQRARLSDHGSDRDLYAAISLVPRRIGKDDLRLTREDLDAAQQARPGWQPAGWSVDQAARLVLLLAGDIPGERFAQRLERLFLTADHGELVAFYRGLPLYPDPARYGARAAEGLRTNMRSVFEAVAHRNPYPAERFSDDVWNQMVLKALFIGSPLHPIQGLDQRANPPLMRMLCDFAHERWAAHRAVSPELWRCVGPHADAAAIADLRRVMRGGSAAEREGAALALAACTRAEAAPALREQPDLAQAIASHRLSWDEIAAR